jgi:Histidine kinase-, DNA gyrase B-, and HSP90-like ATPase
VDVVEVIDDGHGMTYADAVREFQLLGGSWKRDRRKSRNDKRIVHGSEGEGRWRAFSIGDLVRWISVAEVDGRREKITITGLHSALKEFDVSEPEPTNDEVGTTVVIENIREGAAAALLADDAVDHLNAEFALYLEMYKKLDVRYRNFRVDPSTVAKLSSTYTIELENPYGPAQVTVIEWARDVRRVMLLCDDGGMPLGEIPPGIQAPYFDFTAYLRWAGFRENEAELAAAELHPTLGPVIEAAKDHLRLHFKARTDEVQGEVIEEWKQEQVYPYENEPTTQTEQVERELFDVVAVTASRAVNSSVERVGRRLSLRLLRQALEQNPGSLHRVLQEVTRPAPGATRGTGAAARADDVERDHRCRSRGCRPARLSPRP